MYCGLDLSKGCTVILRPSFHVLRNTSVADFLLNVFPFLENSV
jgi:hypothetical protein